MNQLELTEKINQDLSQITPNNLKIIAEFVQFIKQKQETNFITPENQQKLEELRQKIAIGTEQIAQGKITDGELVFKALQDKLKHDYGVE